MKVLVAGANRQIGKHLVSMIQAIDSLDTKRQAIKTASRSFAPYIVAKHYADKKLSSTNLDYTIIHPRLFTYDKVDE